VKKQLVEEKVAPVCDLEVGYVFLYYSIVENRRARSLLVDILETTSKYDIDVIYKLLIFNIWYKQITYLT
jgi:hypothetical protein